MTCLVCTARRDNDYNSMYVKAFAEKLQFLQRMEFEKTCATSKKAFSSSFEFVMELYRECVLDVVDFLFKK